jgi:glycosyltransferase involved in cell wall biosynthesis
MDQLVSVIVPIYQVENFIAAAIRSVLAQTYPHFELLLVDDGSTDGSAAICRGFLDPRIRVLGQPNRGAAAARNTGIRHARGEFLAFLDGDDLFAPSKLRRHLEHLRKAPSVGLSFCRCQHIDDRGRPIGILASERSLYDGTLPALFYRYPCTTASALFVRRSVVEESGYWDEELRTGTDLELCVRIASTTRWRIEGLPDVLTYYRVHDRGLVGGFSAKAQESAAVADPEWVRLLSRIRPYAPELIRDFGPRATRDRFLWLAERLLRLEKGDGLLLLRKAVLHDPRVLWDDPLYLLRVFLLGAGKKLLSRAQYADFRTRGDAAVLLFRRLRHLLPLAILGGPWQKLSP